MQKNEEVELHVRERIKKAIIIMKLTWNKRKTI